MKYSISVSIILAFTLLTTCADRRGKSNNLVGRYVFQTWSHDTIEVSSNGTYFHYNTIEPNRLENKGTWTYDSIDVRMIFADFSFLTDSLPSGYWDTKVDFDGNEVHLIYASEVHKAYYLKVDSIDRSN